MNHPSIDTRRYERSLDEPTDAEARRAILDACDVWGMVEPVTEQGVMICMEMEQEGVLERYLGGWRMAGGGR